MAGLRAVRTISHGGVRLARRASAVADRANAQAADCATIQEMRESPSSSVFVPPTPSGWARSDADDERPQWAG
jgi:hypothetical protein